jgi:hypothetical protein
VQREREELRNDGDRKSIGNEKTCPYLQDIFISMSDMREAI